MNKAPPAEAWLQAAKNTLAQHATKAWKRYHCTLVTPMYGGGTGAGEVDMAMPIRATAIRGQLRYWWRLLNRARYSDTKYLFEAERAIWGGLGDAENLAASRVWVRVEAPAVDTGRLRDKDNSILGRMIITEVGARVRWLQPGYAFDLLLHDPDEDETVARALRLWASFGGVGARRRRGLGAVRVTDASGELVAAKKEDWEAAGCKCHKMKNNPDEPFRSYLEAVESGLRRLIDFRQKAGLARGDVRDQRPGGSLWPEANAVRHLTGRARPANRHALDKDTPIAFPRALFGLPIVFQFRVHESQGDPNPATLEVGDDGEVKRDRFSSPLIFVAIPEMRGTHQVYHPAVLLLPTHRELRNQALKLRLSNAQTVPIPAASWWPSEPESRKNLLPPKLRQKSGERGDVLTAFLNYFIHGEQS